MIDDDREDFELTRVRLESIRTTSYQVQWLDNCHDAIRSIPDNKPDLCLVDYRIGPDSGVDLIRTARAKGIRIPFILLTGQGDYQVEMEALKAGAMDYLPKNELNTQLLDRSIRYALGRRHGKETSTGMRRRTHLARGRHG